MSGPTREQVIGWAQESRIAYEDGGQLFPAIRECCDMTDEAEKFAALAYAAGQVAEREECASLADGWAAVRKSKYGGAALRNFAAALRGDEGACTSNKSLDEMLSDAYAKGRAAEREACAKLCEEKEIPFDIDVWCNSTKKEMTANTAQALAAAIRARGQK